MTLCPNRKIESALLRGREVNVIKRMLSGFAFGLGFSLALVSVWALFGGLIPILLQATLTETDSGVTTEHISPSTTSGSSEAPRNFTLMNVPPMTVPDGGGILMIDPVPSDATSSRPSTIQLWLTEEKLWEIRTVEDRVDVTELSRPADFGEDELRTLMTSKLPDRTHRGGSAIPIAGTDVERVRTGKSVVWDERMNGKLRASSEGAIFLLPDRFPESARPNKTGA